MTNLEQIVLTAYKYMVLSKQCTVDTILEDPSLRIRFLEQVRKVDPDSDEHQILHALTSMRKRSQLPRSRDLLSAGSDQPSN